LTSSEIMSPLAVTVVLGAVGNVTINKRHQLKTRERERVGSKNDVLSL
jgi:hypothetical protein